MARASFETPDDEEVEIDSDDVVHVSAGEEEGTTVIELDDGSEVVVVAAPLEVAAELELDPLDYVDPADDDESLDDLIDEGDGDDV